MGDSAVRRDAVQIPIGQQPLGERRKGDQTFAKTVRGFFEPVVLDRAVEDVVTVLVDDEGRMQLVQDGGGFFECRTVIVGQAHVQRLAAAHGRGECSHGLLERS